MKILKSVLLGLALAGAMPVALAADDRVYDEGPVIEVSYIRTKPGRFDDYMKFLSTTYRTLMEADKKAGLILDYAIYSSAPRSPADLDLLLTITYPNMAALDRTADFDAISAKTVGSMSAQSQAAQDREALREVLGSQLVRKLNLK